MIGELLQTSIAAPSWDSKYRPVDAPYPLEIRVPTVSANTSKIATIIKMGITHFFVFI
jgi:hypothetical protein